MERDEALKFFLQNLLDSPPIAFMWGLLPLLVSSRGLIGRLSLSVAPACRHLGFLSLVGEDGMSQNALLRSVKGLGNPRYRPKGRQKDQAESGRAGAGGRKAAIDDARIISPSATACVAPACI